MFNFILSLSTSSSTVVVVVLGLLRAMRHAVVYTFYPFCPSVLTHDECGREDKYQDWKRRIDGEESFGWKIDRCMCWETWIK